MTEPPALRADARRNRDAVIQAARIAFAARGLDAPLDDIAKAAGVGSGTLYRHFPTRDDLIAAVFRDRLIEFAAALDEARPDVDPWQAFAAYVRYTCRTQAQDRGLAAIFAVGRGGRELADLRNRAYAGLNDLIDAAKRSGDLRDDLSAEDVAVLLIANAGIIERAGDAAKEASERFVALTLDGFRAVGATTAPKPVPANTLLAALRRH